MEFVKPGTVLDDLESGERTLVLASPAETGDRYRIRLTMMAGPRGPGQSAGGGYTDVP